MNPERAVQGVWRVNESLFTRSRMERSILWSTTRRLPAISHFLNHGCALQAAIMVQRGNVGLRAGLDRALEAFTSSGELERLRQRWDLNREYG
jgi:hypothetical protein